MYASMQLPLPVYLCLTLDRSVDVVLGDIDAGGSYGRRSDVVSSSGGREQICTCHQEVHVAHILLR